MKKLIIIILLIVSAFSCKREPISWDVDSLVPILKTKMTVQQAIPDSMISVGSNNELNLIYKGTLIDFKLDSVLSMPDTTTTDIFSWPIGSITLLPGQVFLSDTNFTRFDMGGAKLTHLFIQSGSIDLTLTSSLQGPSVMEYSLPTATKNGVPFFVKEFIPAGTTSAPSLITKSYDLSGYDISLTGINNDNYNVLANAHRAYIDYSSGPVIINAGDKFVASNTFSAVTPSYARGSFGSELIQESAMGEVLDAFDNIAGGTIKLEEVSMIFQINNEVGIDATIKVNDLTGNNTHNNNAITLQSPLSNGEINLNRATEINGIQSGTNPSIYTQIIDNSNSNISQFVSNLPNELNYDFDIQLNPVGNVSNSNDFIYNNTGISIDLDSEIPLNFNAHNLILVDTSEFKIEGTSQEDVSKIISGYINLHANNWYPFALDAQFYLLDSNNIIIDSIFNSPQPIQGGIPVFGMVDTPVYSFLQSPVNDVKIDHLYKTKNIITKIKINSSTTGTANIFEHYFIDLSIVGDFKYLISIE
jgi:hypothetical protein